MQPSSIKPFTFLLIAQAISIFGSALTAFALGVWVYHEVGLVTIYSLIALANGIPIVLLSPIAGTIVDRVSRKHIILASQIASFIITALLMGLYWSELLQPWHIIALVALNSSFMAFVLPAVSATIPLMVPKEQLTRANGMIALAFGIVQLASPAISGLLYSNAGLNIIFILDLSTFLIGILAIAAATIPQPANTTPQKEHVRQSLLEGLRFVSGSYSLSFTIAFYALVVAILLSMGIMIQPLILTITDSKTMGMIMSFAACGMLVGSAVMIFLNQVNRHMPIILLSTLIAGLGCILTPITHNLFLLAIGGFLIMCCFPVFEANNRALLQRKIDPAMLGRVIGWRNFALGITQCILLLSAGLVADHYFEPGMQEGGALAQSFAWLFGTGKGRGIALFISLLGVAIVVVTALAFLLPSIRQMDRLIADHEEPDTVNI